MMVTSLLVNEFTISDLWKLEAIGISDPAESKKKTEVHQNTIEYFRSTLKINEEGRYEVALPWVLESSRLSDNRQMAEKRLDSVYKKLVESDKVEIYTNLFDKWMAEGIIEEVQDETELNVHYLPHRPVIKENSANTKVRPLFDASAHSKGAPSLNACLETDPNLIELVPSLLNRFRKFPVGVTSDIEKAFLQIGIREKDRNYLRFLWKTPEKEMKTYRHRRVVFGVNCSPFLLAATLNYHLEEVPENFSDTARILKNSFYVDNCVCSLKNIDEANKFIMESQTLMSSGKFNLRGWQSNAPLKILDGSESQLVALLGLNCNLLEDTLSCNVNCPREDQVILTKRLLLSLAQSIFDPLGISSPVTIIPKFMLQESWNLGLKWDDVLPEDISKRFLNWLKRIQCLSEVKVPRWMKLGQGEEETVSLHIFCDANPRLRSLNVVTDKNGLLRVKTRAIYRQDTEDFKYPVILPGDHPAVVNLIIHKHKNLMHCGNQILLARLRERYWILKGRKSIRKILKNCVRFRRFSSRSVKMNLPPLPEDRVRDASVFEVSGVDLAGPLLLRDDSKAWIALFTCAVYRGIHLQLLSSMTTESFLLALRRFIARRGRPSVVYSDNGTNFVGAHRILH
ncbi:unnamed protein product, partial [Larinioides sclopetarius]